MSLSDCTLFIISRNWLCSFLKRLYGAFWTLQSIYPKSFLLFHAFLNFRQTFQMSNFPVQVISWSSRWHISKYSPQKSNTNSRKNGKFLQFAWSFLWVYAMPLLKWKSTSDITIKISAISPIILWQRTRWASNVELGRFGARTARKLIRIYFCCCTWKVHNDSLKCGEYGG